MPGSAHTRMTKPSRERDAAMPYPSRMRMAEYLHVSTVALPSQGSVAEVGFPEIVGGPDGLEGRLAGDRFRTATSGDCAAACVGRASGAAECGGGRPRGRGGGGGGGVGGGRGAAGPASRRGGWAGRGGGVWVDRVRRRPLLLAADVGRAVVVGSVPAAALLGRLHIEQLYAVALASSALAVVFEVAYPAYLASLVRSEELLEANSKLEASGAVAEAVGFGAAGALVQALSAPLALAVDAGSYVVSALSLALIQTGEPRPVGIQPLHYGGGEEGGAAPPPLGAGRQGAGPNPGPPAGAGPGGGPGRLSPLR